MSYDLHIWSVSPVSLPESLSDSVGWHQGAGNWVYEGGRWQVAIWPSNRVLQEDVPDHVRVLVPGISYLTELNLAPLVAGADGKRFLTRTAKSLAKAAYGVIEDQQEEIIITPSGIKRYVPLPASETASLLRLSWWTVQGELACRGHVSPLLEVLESVLPEAMPRRYGLYEPPQHVYAETGRLHLEEFLKANLRNGVVWYPHPPVAGVSISVPPEIGWNHIGFRCARMEIEVDVDLLKQPGWHAALRTVWKRVSQVVQPFYGDVRTLCGYSRSRGQYWHVLGTQEHPVQVWWWKGIPRGPAHAVVIGEPYLSLWPSLSAAASQDSGLVFMSTEDWSSTDDVYSIVDAPPDGIVHPDRPGRYASIWPFSSRPSAR